MAQSKTDPEVSGRIKLSGPRNNGSSVSEVAAQSMITSASKSAQLHSVARTRAVIQQVNISDQETQEQRKKSEQRVSVTLQHEANIVKILRHILAASEWKDTSPPTLQRKYVLSAIEYSGVGVQSRRDAGRVLAIFIKRDYFVYFGENDGGLYEPTAKSLTLIKKSQIHTPPEHPIFRRSSMGTVDTVLALAAAKPVKAMEVQAQKTVEEEMREDIVELESAPAVQLGKAEDESQNYMRNICASVTSTGEITREECLDILEEHSEDADSIFQSLVNAGDLSPISGSEEVFQISELWRNTPEPKSQEVALLQKKLSHQPVQPVASEPKQATALNSTSAGFAEIAEKVRRGNIYQISLVETDREIDEIHALVRAKTDRLIELSAKRAEAQAYLESTEYKEAERMVADMKKMIADL